VRKPEINLPDAIARSLDSVGQIEPEPTRKKSNPRWKKPRSQKEKPEPLKGRIKYLPILAHHHRNFAYSWSEVAILSEIDFWMNDRKAPCFASIRHLAAVGRLRLGTAKNTLKRLEANGVLVTMGYHGATKNRVVAPEHSNDPALSKRLIDEFRHRQ
jgi:hypothetical protein